MRTNSPAIATLVIAVVCFCAGVARAGKTYCVGGLVQRQATGNIFEKLAAKVTNAANAAIGASFDERWVEACGDYARYHPNAWHHHMFVQGPGGKCQSCWDENDNTCETIWLVNQPPGQYQKIGEEQCTDPAPTDGAVLYVPDPSEGRALPPPRPKAPVVVDFAGVIAGTSPGPYTIGDQVRLEGGVTDPTGTRRKVFGGRFVVVGPDGKDQSSVNATRAAGGLTVEALVKLTVSGPVRLRFEPGPIDVGASERLGKITPAETTLKASQCRLRGIVRSPSPGEVLIADTPVQLKGELQNTGGAAVGAADLNGATPVFMLEVGGKTKRVPAAFDASGASLSATVTLDKPAAGSEPVVVRLVGEGGANDVCPGAPASAKVTALGLDLATVTTGNCYVGRPCDLAATFQLPRDDAALAAGQTFVKTLPSVTVKVNDTSVGDLKPQRPGDPTSAFTGSFLPKDDGSFTLETIATVGGQEVRQKRSIRIRQPMELVLPDEIDLGVIKAGTWWSDACTGVLDFSRSRGVLGETFDLVATPSQGCSSTPAIRLGGGLAAPLSPAVEGMPLPVDRRLTICLANAPHCSKENPEPVLLTVRPTSGDFRDTQVRKIRLRWRVEGRSFITCYRGWLELLGGALAVMFIGYGWVKPSRFTPQDSVKLARKLEQLPRATARRLQELPGGRPGWYRSSATGLRDDGSASNKLRTVAVELHARNGEVVLISRGGLQRMSPQSKKLEAVAEASKEGHVASKHVVYNVGGLFFQVS